MPDLESREHLNLPATRGGDEVEEVLDGELVAEETAAPGLIATPAPVRTVIILRPVVQVFQTINVVVQAPPAKAVARHGSYVAAGIVVAARRRRKHRTLTAEMAHLAAARGDLDKAVEWARQDHEQQHQRAERRRRAWEAAGRLLHPQTLKGIAVAVAVVVALLVMTGWVRYAIGLYHLVSAVLAFAWDARYGVPAVVLLWLWHLGRTAGSLAPSWSIAAKPGEQDRGLVVTADGIVVALKNLPVSDLRKAFKDGWTPAFHTLPIRDGEGYFSVFSVPMGITPAMIADKNEIFARNLHRAEIEVWPTDAERGKVAPAGFVSLWVANPGVLDRPAPEWPLLNEGTADVFKGVPAGVGPRGEQLSIRIVANNLVCGGIMGMGKSNACRVVMLGAALDPLAELWVHVFAYNGDFDCYEPRLARYVKGAEEAQLMEAMDTLHELYAEVDRRERRLSELGAKKVTRDLAQRYPDLRPRLVLFSECHELFGSKDYGEEATELAANTMRRARKTAIWLGFDTQDARKDAIPPKLVGLVSVNVCFFVKTWRANDGFLGDGSFQAGIRATELRPTRDVGRSVTTGVSDAQFELLKWHYIFSDDDTGQDDAAPVIARAMKNVAPGTPVAGNSPQAAITVRDLLGDLDQALGRERVKVRDAVGLLRQVDRLYPGYRQMTAVQLREALLGEGVRTVNASGTHYLDPVDLRRVLAVREAGE